MFSLIKNLFSARKTGEVSWFNEEKGYGFIELTTGQKVFVHYSDINVEGYKCLRAKQIVELKLVKNEKGLQAKEVTVQKKAK